MSRIQSIAYFLIRFFADWPLPYIIVFASIWQSQFSLVNLGVFSVSFLINMSLMSLLGTYHEGQLLFYIQEYIKKYSRCIFQAFALDSYIPKDKIQLDFYFSKEKIVNQLWDKIRDNIITNSRIFSVKGSDNAIERPLGLKVFPLNNAIYIFTRENPEEMNPILRFKLLHEYFHASVPAMLNKRRIMLSIGPNFFLITYLVLHTSLHLENYLPLICIASIYYTGYKHYWHSEKQQEPLQAELYADYMALKSLSDSEINFMIRYKRKYDLVAYDNSLTELQNTTRKYYFRELLDQYEKGETPSIFKIESTKDYPSYIYVVFVLSIFATRNLAPVNINYFIIDLVIFTIISLLLWLLLEMQRKFELRIGTFLNVDIANQKTIFRN